MVSYRVHDARKENVLHTQPLPISSVAVSKNCFRLIDAETGQPFDIEDELGVYERLLAGIVNDIIHEHNFSRLRHTHPDDFPVEKLTSFAVMQLMLNLHNPQNKNPYKQEMLEQFHADIQDHLSEYIHSINQLPHSNPELMDDHSIVKYCVLQTQPLPMRINAEHFLCYLAFYPP